MHHNGLHCIHVVSQYDLSGQQLSNFATLNMHIFEKEEYEGKITYLKRKLVSLKWMSEPVQGENELGAAI